MKSGWIPAVMLVLLITAACGTTEPDRTSSPVTTFQPARAPGPITLALLANFDACRFSCRAYVSFNRVGEAPGAESAVSKLGAGPEAQGLPTTLDPGSYVVHFRLVMVSDAIVNGVAEETTIATCDEGVLAEGTHLAEEVELLVNFHSQSCDVTQTSKVADA
jgi:hypothetical protein